MSLGGSLLANQRKQGMKRLWFSIHQKYPSKHEKSAFKSDSIEQYSNISRNIITWLHPSLSRRESLTNIISKYSSSNEEIEGKKIDENSRLNRCYRMKRIEFAFDLLNNKREQYLRNQKDKHRLTYQQCRTFLSTHFIALKKSNAVEDTAENTNKVHTDIDLENGIIVTKSCANRLKQLQKKKNDPNLRLRVHVDGGGCSGFQYHFTIENQEQNDGEDEENEFDPEEDQIFVQHGISVVVDESSLEFIKGSTIDYVTEMIRSSFAVINNPNSESACGCGSSFALKQFEINPAKD